MFAAIIVLIGSAAIPALATPLFTREASMDYSHSNATRLLR